MKAKKLVGWCAAALVAWNVVGCHEHNTVLSETNYRQKFDQVEAATRERPGQIGPSDLEAIVGLGESITTRHEDLAYPPPGVTIEGMSWTRWAFQNEVLLVGFAENRAASVIRLQR